MDAAADVLWLVPLLRCSRDVGRLFAEGQLQQLLKARFRLSLGGKWDLFAAGN